MVSGLGPEAEKQGQIMKFSPPYFTVGMMYWCWLIVPFLRHTFHSSVVVCHGGLWQTSASSNVFFWRAEASSVVFLPWIPYLSKNVHMLDAWTGVSASFNEVFMSLAVIHGFFFTSWMTLRCALGIIYDWCPLLGRVATVLNCLLMDA